MGGSSRKPGSKNKINCEDLEFQISLQSPDLDTLADIEEADVLDIGLHHEGGQYSLVAKTQDGKIAGTIASTNSRRVRACIERGYRYSAEVTEIDIAYCTVIIWCSHQP